MQHDRELRMQHGCSFLVYLPIGAKDGHLSVDMAFIFVGSERVLGRNGDEVAVYLKADF